MRLRNLVMLKTLTCPVRVVWVYRKSQWIALFSTDLDLTVSQIVEYYGARWKIEAGFKEIKQDIGSAKSQTRNPIAVTNHLNFCMLATATPGSELKGETVAEGRVVALRWGNACGAKAANC